MFDHRELQTLVSGAEVAIDVEDMRKNAAYSGTSATAQVCFFTNHNLFSLCLSFLVFLPHTIFHHCVRSIYQSIMFLIFVNFKFSPILNSLDVEHQITRHLCTSNINIQFVLKLKNKLGPDDNPAVLSDQLVSHFVSSNLFAHNITRIDKQVFESRHQSIVFDW